MSATHLETTPFASGGGGNWGVRMPTGAQDQAGSHGLALKPGLHSVLHWAYPLS